MQKLLASFALFSLIFAALPSPEAQASTSVRFGDLIRGETFSAVYYYGEDGFRYVFPNEKTYFSWYSDFSGVTTVSDAELGSIQIGGNVTYKPGTSLIKITTDPKVYAVNSNGHLHWVETEEVAEGMFGSDWATRIDDVPDAFFSNYSIVWPLSTVEDAQAFQMGFLSHEERTINDDKGLQAPWEISITSEGFSPDTVSMEEWLESFGNYTFRFTNNDNVAHTATADDNSWGTGTIQPGESYLIRFDGGGVWPYHCSYHSDMTGSITTDDIESW